jgi:hypothetical protein
MSNLVLCKATMIAKRYRDLRRRYHQRSMILVIVSLTNCGASWVDMGICKRQSRLGVWRLESTFRKCSFAVDYVSSTFRTQNRVWVIWGLDPTPKVRCTERDIELPYWLRLAIKCRGCSGGSLVQPTDTDSSSEHYYTFTIYTRFLEMTTY